MASNILNFEVSTSQRELVDRYNIYTKQLQQANIKNIPLDCSKRNGFKIDDKSKSIKKKPAKRILNKFKYWNDGQDFSIVITDTSNDLDIEVLPSDYVQSVDWDDVDVESVELENNGDNNVEHGNSEINGDIIALNGIDTEKIIDDSTIDDNNNKNNDNDCEDGDKIKELEDTVVNVEQFSRSLYNFHYAKNRSLYISFDSTGSSDMRFLVGLFKDFDVVKDTRIIILGSLVECYSRVPRLSNTLSKNGCANAKFHNFSGILIDIGEFTRQIYKNVNLFQLFFQKCGRGSFVRFVGVRAGVAT